MRENQEVINDNKLYILLGKNIRKYRKLKNLSQDNLAYESGVNRAYIGYIERSEKKPSIRTVNKIAHTLKIELYKFFVFDDKTEG